MIVDVELETGPAAPEDIAVELGEDAELVKFNGVMSEYS